MVSLRDGRQLSYAEYGDPTGKPLFYFHGIPGSRMECPVDESYLQTKNIRLIAPERPGYGLSDTFENRRILDWPDDLAQLADNLGLEQFHVLGFSGGGSYALACARQRQERVVATGLLGCVAPMDVPGMRDAVSPAFRGMYELAAKAPDELEQQFAPLAAAPEGVVLMVEEAAPEPDQAAFADPVFRKKFVADFSESLRQGAKAVVWDLHLAATPWGFDLARIQSPVQLWHGTSDLNAGPAMGHYLADTLPQCHATFMENEGHYSLLNHMERMLQELMEL
jgi:pimeloyl-ACP methyl ester carboxylesterase